MKCWTCQICASRDKNIPIGKDREDRGSPDCTGVSGLDSSAKLWSLIEPEGSLVTIAGSEDPGPSPLPLRASACAIVSVHPICDGQEGEMRRYGKRKGGGKRGD